MSDGYTVNHIRVYTLALSKCSVEKNLVKKQNCPELVSWSACHTCCIRALVLSLLNCCSLSGPELASLAEIKIPFLYGTLKLFVQWIMDGFYDFCELDIPLKRHLSPVNDWAIKDLCSKEGMFADCLSFLLCF